MASRRETRSWTSTAGSSSSSAGRRTSRSSSRSGTEMAMRFQGKVALITAAGAGIGRATAGIIGREGGTVVAVDVDQTALDRLAGEIGAAGGRALGIAADALDAAAAEGVVRR